MFVGQEGRMRSVVRGAFWSRVTASAFALAALFVVPAGCAGGRAVPGTPASGAPGEQGSPRPADAEADAAYYQTRAVALAQGARTELAQTDFARLRRGRLYAPRSIDASTARSLDQRLVMAVSARDHAATLDLTAKILGDDQTDIQAQLARSVALRKLARAPEADFHRDLAAALVKSIMATGDGRRAGSAWTVFQMKEEDAMLKVLGRVAVSRATTPEGDRQLDVVKARKADGGDTVDLYFDISELSSEQQRSLAAR
jgi:uncharacterized protein DUF4919